MSKLANPWKCDAPACGILRANDTNHWLLVYTQDADDEVFLGPPRVEVVISPWNSSVAEHSWAKHTCGVDCALKVAASLVHQHCFRNEFPGPQAPERK